MSAPRKLLVVDDESVICQACSRVFTPQGFEVETCRDPIEGLCRAAENEYVAILLDIKMPGLGGIEFLESLRKDRRDTPVIFITGYPNVQTAAAAVRLGAADYVTKPFSPEEITQAIQALVRSRRGDVETPTDIRTRPEVSAAPASDVVEFYRESWVRRVEDGTVRVGAVLPRPPDDPVDTVHLPRIGDVVYQGLPLAGYAVIGGPLRCFPAPVSGVVIAVHEFLQQDASALWRDPCGLGWVACLSPTRLEEESEALAVRQVILANIDDASAEKQRDHLALRGCQVRRVKDRDELCDLLQGDLKGCVMIDVDSLGAIDESLLDRIGPAAASKRIVAIGSPASRWEAAFRERGVFYWAVEPFADGEIVDILDSAFRPLPTPDTRVESGKLSAEPVAAIRVTNRHRKHICVLVAGAWLRRASRLGRQIEKKLREGLFPVEWTLGAADVSPGGLLKAAERCDRLLVLLVENTGRLPGTLLADTKGRTLTLPERHTSWVTALVVQPSFAAGQAVAFDDVTIDALATHIVREMTAEVG